MAPLLAELRRLVEPRRAHRAALVAVPLLAMLAPAAWLVLAEPDGPLVCEGPSPVLEAWGEPQRARVAAAMLATGLPHAPATWERVEQGLDAYAEAWTAQHVETCAATHVRGEQPVEVMDLRMACLRDRRVALREAVEVLSHADATRVERAVSLVAELPGLSRCDDVEALQADLPPPEDPGVFARVTALREQLVRVDSLEGAGAYDEALAEAEEVVAQADALGYEPLRAEVRLRQGVIHERKAQYDEAAQDLELAYLLAVEAGHPTVAIQAMTMLASVVGYHQGRFEDGRRWGRAALVLARGPRADRLLESRALSALAAIALVEGATSEAVPWLRSAVALQEEVLGRDHPTVARTLSNLGIALQAQGKLTEAIELFRRSLAIQEAALGPLHPKVAAALSNLGAALGGRGEWDEALVHHRRALSIEVQSLGPDHPSVGDSLLNVGAALSARGEHEAALEPMRQSLALFEAALGPHDPKVARARLGIAHVLEARGQGPEAIEHLRRSVAIFEDALGPRHPTVASALSNLGLLLLAQGEPAKARTHLERALTIKEGALGPHHPDLAFTLVGLAEVALAQQEPTAARAYAERALSIREAAEVAPAQLAEARLLLGKALWADPAEHSRARALVQQAHDAYAALGSAHVAELQAVRRWIAEHHDG